MIQDNMALCVLLGENAPVGPGGEVLMKVVMLKKGKGGE